MSRPDNASGRPLASAAGVFVAMLCAWLASAAEQPPTYLQKTRTFHTAEQFAATTGGRVRIERSLDPQLDARPRRMPIRLPIAEFPVAATASPSINWIGTS